MILILLFGAIFAGSGSVPVVYAQNQDAGPVGAAFLQTLNQTGSLQITLVPTSQNFSQYLLSHSSSDGIIVPQDFTADYGAGQPVKVTEYWNPSSSTSQVVFGVVSGVVNEFNLQRVNGTAVLGVGEDHRQVEVLHVHRLPDSGDDRLRHPGQPHVRPGEHQLPVQAGQDIQAALAHAADKTDWLLVEDRVLHHNDDSLLPPDVGVGIFAFGAHITFTPWVIPFLLLGPFMFVSLGMLVGTVSTSVESAAVVGNLITFPMMFLSGTFFPASGCPPYLQNIAHVLPLFYVIQGLNNVMIYGNDLRRPSPT